MSGQFHVPVMLCRDLEARAGECVIIDVRSPTEFRETHIPGSINLPLADLGRFTAALKAKADGANVVLVCRTGKRASIALDELLKEGVSECHVLEGGISSWGEAGLPTMRGRQAISIERQVRIVAGVLIALGSTLGILVSPWLVSIPAAIGLGLVMAGITDSCAMALLLTRMPWNRLSQATICERPSTPQRSAERTR